MSILSRKNPRRTLRHHTHQRKQMQFLLTGKPQSTYPQLQQHPVTWSSMHSPPAPSSPSSGTCSSPSPSNSSASYSHISSTRHTQPSLALARAWVSRLFSMGLLCVVGQRSGIGKVPLGIIWIILTDGRLRRLNPRRLSRQLQRRKSTTGTSTVRCRTRALSSLQATS